MRYVVLISGALLVTAVVAQVDVTRKVRLPIWTFHAPNTTTVGVNLGAGTLRDDRPRNVRTIGVHAEAIGLGLFLLLGPREATVRDSADFAERMALIPSERIHGVSASPLGMICDCLVDGISLNGGGLYAKRVNGISAAYGTNQVDLHRGAQVSAIFTFAYHAIGFQGAFVHASAHVLHGLQLSAINVAGKARGLQIGVFNRAKNLRGLQIGIWNVNQKRKLPLLNWG